MEVGTIRAIKRLFAPALAVFLLAGGAVLGPSAIEGVGEAQGAQCGVAGLYDGGYSRATGCSYSQYSEKANGSWYYAPVKLRYVTSQFNVCFYKYQSSGASFW